MKEMYLKILEINLDSNESVMDSSSVAAMRNAIDELRKLP